MTANPYLNANGPEAAQQMASLQSQRTAMMNSIGNALYAANMRNMGLGAYMAQQSGAIGISKARSEFWGPRYREGDVAYLSPYWIEVVSFSPQSRIVRYRRVHEQTIRRMGRLAFERKARPA